LCVVRGVGRWGGVLLGCCGGGVCGGVWWVWGFGVWVVGWVGGLCVLGWGFAGWWWGCPFLVWPCFFRG
ncbi:hypothetical protein, partial [Escherichia coli]|uniref:hypothetical protein n=1 Tax=Escherichia coli TaxID=562 RepID=UPI0021CA3993